jgi:radical SAM protein with 4Fe4S-binding SPASM domain
MEKGVNKMLISDEYNYVFNKVNGNFARWGKTQEEDPTMAPFGPEILDIEVTTICNGVPNKDGIVSPCAFCYKSNGPKGINMSFETFKEIIDKLPYSVNKEGKKCFVCSQIAFGADATCTANPDIWKMMDYCRENGIVPNITVANVTDETAKELAKRVGAVAVSRYANKNVCYDTIVRLANAGVKQLNIHHMISNETFDDAMETLHDMKIDERLKSVRAVVLLSLKPKGRGEKFTSLGLDKFKELVDYGLDNGIGIGFDSCGANKFLAVIKDRPNYKELELVSEPCESLQFSYYFNSEGFAFPCSFMEEIEQGVHISKINDFLKDLWFSDYAKNWRERLTKSCRSCPVYKV